MAATVSSARSLLTTISSLIERALMDEGVDVSCEVAVHGVGIHWQWKDQPRDRRQAGHRRRHGGYISRPD
jgi:hypothetical protein